MNGMRKRLIFLIFLLGLLLIRASAQEDLPKAGRYVIVPEESRIEIKTGSSGVLGFMGHGHTIAPKTITGEMELKPKETIPASITVRIDATSLQEIGDFKPEDKKEIETQLHGPVLETSRFPEILFQSTNVKYSISPGHVIDAQIEGDLTLHGIKRNITVPVRVTDDGTKLRATGKYEINRPDYKIETKSAGGGTVKVSKKLEVDLELVLKSQ
jgi:polyisoprenoid-binding protein YceI